MEKIRVETKKHIDIMYLDQLIDTVSEVMTSGYGKVNFEVSVQGGNITMITITRSVTKKVEE